MNVIAHLTPFDSPVWIAMLCVGIGIGITVTLTVLGFARRKD